MENKLKKIPIPFEEFKETLDKNSKVLFSGVFGSGKTTFINDFFDNEETYESIHIYPVNYSVASNEDIFELIKYDILFQLIGKIPKDDFFKLELPYHLTLFHYLIGNNDIENKADFFISFLNFVKKYGSGLIKAYEQLKFLKNKYIKYHEQFQEDDLEQIISKLEEPQTQKGHIYEEDFFTELIRMLISQIREERKNKIVLVIDDFDRLDPDHIFRLLNIFSAHIDFRGVDADNKFDFDKVILVCDYSNIENVFIHRYGENADFKGYIDKFYTDIYWHNVSTFIGGIIGQYLSEVKTDVDYNFFQTQRRVGGHIKFILNRFLSFNLLNFRDLVKFSKTFYLNDANQLKQKITHKQSSLLKRYNLNVELVIFFFIKFFHNNHELLKIISKAKSKELTAGNDDFDIHNLDKICELLLMINHSKYGAEISMPFSEEPSVTIQHEDKVFKFRIIKEDYTLAANGIEVQDVNGLNIDLNKKHLSYFEYLEEAVITYLDLIQ